MHFIKKWHDEKKIAKNRTFKNVISFCNCSQNSYVLWFSITLTMHKLCASRFSPSTLGKCLAQTLAMTKLTDCRQKSRKCIDRCRAHCCVLVYYLSMVPFHFWWNTDAKRSACEGRRATRNEPSVASRYTRALSCTHIVSERMCWRHYVLNKLWISITDKQSNFAHRCPLTKSYPYERRVFQPYSRNYSQS